MLSKLQKKPLSVRKKIALAAILLATSALIIPLWLLSISQTLKTASEKQAPRSAKNNAQTFAELEKQFSTAFHNYQELKKAIDEVKNTFQTPPLKATLPSSGQKAPTLPERAQ